MKVKCPNCGGNKFIVDAHVVQSWYVDENGDFEDVYEDCVEVSHFPNKYDIWSCNDCGYDFCPDEFGYEE